MARRSVSAGAGSGTPGALWVLQGRRCHERRLLLVLVQLVGRLQALLMAVELLVLQVLLVLGVLLLLEQLNLQELQSSGGDLDAGSSRIGSTLRWQPGRRAERRTEVGRSSRRHPAPDRT
jgi:hypothetical protein